MENNLKSQNDYNSYLALEYLEFARSFDQVENGYLSRYFAKKGLESARGSEVIPENPLKWNADKAQMEELIAMQKRIEALMTMQVKNQLPIQMAHLRYLYDCWVSKEAKPIFRATGLAPCKTKFHKLLDELEHYFNDIKQEKEPRTEITELEFKTFEILFDVNSHKLNDKASRDLITVLKYLLPLNGHYRLMLIGSADTLGNEVYNQSLALRRVEYVENFLVKNGVSKKMIEVKSFGQDMPDVVTKDDVKNQHNRTVKIYILKGGFESFLDLPMPLIENYIYRENIKKARSERGLE